MGLLRWDERPLLEEPVLIAAFDGWNDAGNAASEALTYLSRTWGATKFAAFDSEELFDFSSARPHVKLEEGDTRSLDWPEVRLARAAVPAPPERPGQRHAVLVSGPEPQLRWRSFCQEFCDAAVELGVRTAVLLGALLADVPHTRPTRVSGGSGTPELAALAELEPSYYEGPTGIVGVTSDGLARVGIPTVSLWASVPHYISQSPSPKATLALVERTSRVLGAEVDVTELQIATAAYERQIDELVASDEEATAYVKRLEEQDEEASRAEAELSGTEGGPRLGFAAGERLAAEVERYLREHRRD